MSGPFNPGRFSYWLNHPAGPKTVHFWAPLFKWSLVMASIGDLKRPPDTVSIGQSAALTATGFIWTRYATQIVPMNYSLLTVNLFIGISGLYQLIRATNAQWL